MKKVAIITLYGETNYGNRLQNYAVNKYLTQQGFECETLIFKEKVSLIDFLKEKLKKIICYTLVKGNELNRVISFESFSKRYIPVKTVSVKENFIDLSKRYDYFVIGSDQVWNPCFGSYEKYYDQMFVTFAPKKKKICFSPSFGVSEIPNEWKTKFKNALLDFDKISVREDAGVRIVKELTGKEAQCLIDPTLLFDADEWIKVANKPKETQYTFVYFLGDYSSEQIPTELKIVDILNKNNGNYYRYNPSDFIGLIAGSEVVYTDSFHACVFSILFDKPFCILKRKDNYQPMSSRIDSLLSIFGVNYNIESPSLIHINKDVRDKILTEKRKEVNKFLSSQMGMEDA